MTTVIIVVLGEVCGTTPREAAVAADLVYVTTIVLVVIVGMLVIVIVTVIAMRIIHCKNVLIMYNVMICVGVTT